MATTLLSAEQCEGLWCTSAIAFRCIADLDACFLQFNVIIFQMMCCAESLHKLNGCVMGIPNLECDTGPLSQVRDKTGTRSKRLVQNRLDC